VMESFGFTALLRKNTSGQAFPQLVFSHWQVVDGDLSDPDTDSLGVRIMNSVRARKGMNSSGPIFTDYYDKL